MWSRLAALAAPRSLRLLRFDRGADYVLDAVDGVLDIVNRALEPAPERRRRVVGRGALGLAEHTGPDLGFEGLAAAPGVLPVTLEQGREDGRRDEDRRHGTDRDADHDREGEVAQRRAAEGEQRDDREQRDRRGYDR